MRWKLEHLLKKAGGSILFEDDVIMAINKPAGLLVLPDRYSRELVNLYDLLKETIGSVYVVHRIDKETSGAILFAKTRDAHAILNRQFENHTVQKKYIAIVAGVPNVDSGTIELPIIESNRKMCISEYGKNAITKYKTLEKFNNYSVLELSPLTGRMHQLRVHLSAIGLPIIGDPIYGDGKSFLLSNIKHNYRKKEEEIEKPLIDRTALHAFSLEFIHPSKNDRVKIEATIPKDMEAVLKALRKYSKRSAY